MFGNIWGAARRTTREVASAATIISELTLPGLMGQGTFPEKGGSGSNRKLLGPDVYIAFNKLKIKKILESVIFS